MKWFNKAFIVILLMYFFSACKKDDKVAVIIEPAMLDTIFSNTFEGIIPCPDCPGVETSIRIYKDSTISRTIYYEAKNELPLTKVGTWKLKDSVFIATFDREKLFFKIKDHNSILRVGSDLKEVKGELAPDYVLHKKDKFKFSSIEGDYTVGDTLNLFNKLNIEHLKNDKYNLHFTFYNKLDSLTNCTTKLNAILDNSYQLNAALKPDGNLRIVFTKKEAHVLFENIHKDSVKFNCNDSLRFVPFQASYTKRQ
ncbi:copper resistance protein NlpE N-terminal domain-containing protein [Paenimyroides viscosum]|uniref:Copper resistance protein NlpE n=1 Tax=Paenimyroides viscosum TaxID=2488729 RepID=A0A3P1B6W1_9FLAO|nr:copper resistance protein NlpE N-terminal domain-containing protein [Paenimyroides viscosum]RRA96472.1 hypothetical protein EG242_02420 [Paenimyroides viscosum]